MNRLLTTLIVVLATANMNAQQMSEVPKLVVGITIDQLRGDYLRYLYDAFGEKGLKRLMREGLVYENVNFDFENPDCASGMATLFTGSYPYHNGIISGSIFNTGSMRPESIFNDKGFMGNFTTETVSPKNLLVSTITDELKMASYGLSKVFAFAPYLEQALISGGHAADGAFWIDNVNGKWATTAFYKDAPFYIDNYNRKRSLDMRIDTLQWVPVLSPSEYNFLPYISSEWSFKHNFNRVRKDKYDLFKSSALVNDEINRIVETVLKNADIGKKNNPDFLSITYDAGIYKNGTVQEFPAETQDKYLRLDKSIEELLTMIDRYVGLKNTFIYLTSSGNIAQQSNPYTSQKVSTGQFHPKRCVALLNMYLMAIYGQDNWVSHQHNNQIYLNRKLIEDKKIDLNEIQTKSAEFIIQFSGVQDVVTSHQLLHGNWNEHNHSYLNGYNPNMSGDLMIAVQPGWEVVYEDPELRNYTQRYNSIPAPLIFFGPQVKAEKIKRTVDATEIAPTISHVIRIRAPNACSTLPLPEFR